MTIATTAGEQRHALDALPFENTYVCRLPEIFYARVAPTPLRNPRLVTFNDEAAGLIGLCEDAAEDPLLVEAFSGARLLPGSEPIAMLYAGHQFGVWVPQLGDGRAILLGQVRDGAGRLWDLHLKGAGPTPYSRGGDGRAVLRSTIREHLGSEAMHALGIPTTRSLAVIGSDEPVYRETIETGATLLRLAPSHVRFGHFEVLHHRGRHEDARRLADLLIGEHFPALTELPEGERCGALLEEAIVRTARLIARWQSVGFTHGVMNTDNFSMLGLTLDYGPFAFMDAYDPGFIPNHSDDMGRYAFDRQPGIGLWNCAALAQAFLSLVSETRAREALAAYEPAYVAAYLEIMRAKLGLTSERGDDPGLIAELLRMMHVGGADHTAFFRRLCDLVEASDDGRAASVDAGGQAAASVEAQLAAMSGDAARFATWCARYRARLADDGATDDEARQRRAASMRRVNPKYVLRTHMAQRAIERAERDDPSEIERLLRLLRRPFDEQPEFERDAAPPPPEERGVELSCSS